MSSLSSVRAANAAAGKFPGRRAVVVGGTSGIGCAIALRLAQADFSVTVVGRNAAVGAEVVAEMRAAGGRDHEFVACDSQLIANAYQFGNTYASTHDSLDVLVMTQGIATMQGRTETSEGLDQKLALHYYSRMAFVDALLPLLRRSPSPRVLTVLSAGVHNPYPRYATDPDLKQYSLAEAANSAGFYNDIAMDSLSRQPENNKIVFVHAAPGFVNTNWGKELNAVLRAFVRFIQPLGRRPRDCAEFMCSILLQPRQPGFLLMGANTQLARPTTLHDAAREAVWAHTVDVLDRVKRTLNLPALQPLASQPAPTTATAAPAAPEAAAAAAPAPFASPEAASAAPAPAVPAAAAPPAAAASVPGPATPAPTPAVTSRGYDV